MYMGSGKEEKFQRVGNKSNFVRLSKCIAQLTIYFCTDNYNL